MGRVFFWNGEDVGIFDGDFSKCLMISLWMGIRFTKSLNVCMYVDRSLYIGQLIDFSGFFWLD